MNASPIRIVRSRNDAGQIVFKNYADAADIRPGTIVRPFDGDDRFDVERVELTAAGAARFFSHYGEMVEMDQSNAVEILGHFNLDD